MDANNRGWNPVDFSPMRQPKQVAPKVLSADAPVFVPKLSASSSVQPHHHLQFQQNSVNHHNHLNQPQNSFSSGSHYQQQGQQQHHHHQQQQHHQQFIQQSSIAPNYRQNTHHPMATNAVPHPNHHASMINNHGAGVNNHGSGGGGGGGGTGGGGGNSKQTAQNRLNQYRGAPGPVSSQQHGQLLDQGQNDGDNEDYQPNQTETVALDLLTEMVTKLNDNPGMFDIFQKKFTDIFFELSGNHFVLSNAVELLFEQAINEQNFRYTGARLCHLLDDMDPSPDSVFRNLVSMKMNYEKNQLQQCMQNEQRKVRGTTLFYAELYMQLRKPNDVARNVEIALCIKHSISLLLSKSGPENVKCVCQSLKLCGFELDTDCKTDTNLILRQLEIIEPSLDVSTGRLVRSVLDLKNKHWGRGETFALPASVTTCAQQDYNDSPVFYGPDGQILTEEESSFLSSNVSSYPNFNLEDLIDDDSDDLVDDDDDDEMDLEMQMAFKEFVSSQPK